MKALFSALEVYRYIDGEWKPARVNLKEATPVAALRVVTYNTLFDYFDADKIYTLQRNRLLFKLLESTDADIIGLQVRLRCKPKFSLLGRLTHYPAC
jgi:hypothetical protein